MDQRYANRSVRPADDSIDLVLEARQVGTGCESDGADKPRAQKREEQRQASSIHPHTVVQHWSHRVPGQRGVGAAGFN